MTDFKEYKNTKRAKEIIAAQNLDGLWGNFHSLAVPKKNGLTTEQALRKLQILGYEISDPPIAKIVNFMSDCLSKRKIMPDKREKSHDWDAFTELMLATWIRRFTYECVEANRIAQVWSAVITDAFSNAEYNHEKYLRSYEKYFGKKAKGTRLVDFVSFYQISLVGGMLNEKTDSKVVDYLLNKSDGIYYIYDNCLSQTPKDFASKNAVRYLAALELLSKFLSREKLHFAVEWLNNNKNDNGKWDMGKMARDNIYFPLSDSWRTAEARESDCTYLIQKLLNEITK